WDDAVRKIAATPYENLSQAQKDMLASNGIDEEAYRQYALLEQENFGTLYNFVKINNPELELHAYNPEIAATHVYVPHKIESASDAVIPGVDELIDKENQFNNPPPAVENVPMVN